MVGIQMLQYLGIFPLASHHGGLRFGLMVDSVQKMEEIFQYDSFRLLMILRLTFKRLIYNITTHDIILSTFLYKNYHLFNGCLWTPPDGFIYSLPVECKHKPTKWGKVLKYDQPFWLHLATQWKTVIENRS